MAEYEPIPDWDDDYDVPDDDDNADQTGAFGPLSSTPAPEFQTAQKEKSGLTEPPVFLEDLSEAPGQSEIFRVSKCRQNQDQIRDGWKGKDESGAD